MPIIWTDPHSHARRVRYPRTLKERQQCRAWSRRITLAILLTLVYLLGFAAFASADEPPSKSGLRPFVLTYATAATLDLASTYPFLRDGYREANPLGRWIDHRPKAAIATYATIDAAVVLTLHHAYFKRHPKAERFLLVMAAGVRVLAASQNLSIRGGQRHDSK